MSASFLIRYAEDDTAEPVNRIVKVTNKKDVLCLAKAAFSLTGDNYAIDVFNREYNLYVRADDPKDLPDGGQLRLTRIRHKSNPGPPGESTPLRPSISTAETLPILSEGGPSFSGDLRQAPVTIGDLLVESSDT